MCLSLSVLILAAINITYLSGCCGTFFSSIVTVGFKISYLAKEVFQCFKYAVNFLKGYPSGGAFNKY